MAQVLVSSLPAILTPSQSIVNQALTNEVIATGSNRDLVIDSNNALGFSRSNSTYKPYGSMLLVNNALQTDITAVNTPSDIVNTNIVLGAQVLDFVLEANKGLKYIGTQSKVFQISVFLDVLSGSDNQKTTTYLLKNNNVENLPRISQRIDKSSQNGSISCIVQLAQNDVISLKIENNSGANSLTVQNLSICAVCIS